MVASKIPPLLNKKWHNDLERLLKEHEESYEKLRNYIVMVIHTRCQIKKSRPAVRCKATVQRRKADTPLKERMNPK